MGMCVSSGIGGLIALSMRAPSPGDDNLGLNTDPEVTAPGSISGGAATKTAPAAPHHSDVTHRIVASSALTEITLCPIVAS